MLFDTDAIHLPQTSLVQQIGLAYRSENGLLVAISNGDE
jgi:hypothetical protein